MSQPLASTCGVLTPLAALPSKAGSCDTAMVIAAPVENPLSTGALSSAASASSLNQAASASSTPASVASTSAAASGLTPDATTGAIACAVISDTPATGPTEFTLLDPSAA